SSSPIPAPGPGSPAAARRARSTTDAARECARLRSAALAWKRLARVLHQGGAVVAYAELQAFARVERGTAVTDRQLDYPAVHRRDVGRLAVDLDGPAALAVVAGDAVVGLITQVAGTARVGGVPLALVRGDLAGGDFRLGLVVVASAGAERQCKRKREQGQVSCGAVGHVRILRLDSPLPSAPPGKAVVNWAASGQAGSTDCACSRVARNSTPGARSCASCRLTRVGAR